MTDLMLMKYSAIRDAAPSIEQYEWHLNTLKELRSYDSAKNTFDVTLDGKSILMGAFEEPTELEAYFELCEQIRKACLGYLEKCLPGIENELRGVGVDPNA